MNRDGANRLITWRELVGTHDIDRWLEHARRKLLFRSHAAMHRAIAAATTLTYHAVHKALSGGHRPRRLPVGIRECLHGWLRIAAAGRAIEAADEHRAVPVARMRALLPALLEQFGTKVAICRALSERTGVRVGTLRRYFYRDGQVGSAPLAVYCEARALVDAAANANWQRRDSYLRDAATRQAAEDLAKRCRRKLELMQQQDDPAVEAEYRELRLALIATVKEQRPQPVQPWA